MGPLTQEEADTLSVIEKLLTNPNSIRMPEQGTTKIYPVHYFREGKRNNDMSVSTYRGTIDARKVSYRLLYNNNIVLIRIDTHYRTKHINPDKTVIQPMQPHIHLYSEQHGDKYAYPLPQEFSDTEDIIALFLDFLSYSHIINVNEVQVAEQGVLFDA